MCCISYHLPMCWSIVQSSYYETLLAMMQTVKGAVMITIPT